MKKLIVLMCAGIMVASQASAQRPAPTPEQLAAQKPHRMQRRPTVMT